MALVADSAEELLRKIEGNAEKRYPQGNERWWWEGWLAHRVCQRRHPWLQSATASLKGRAPCAECRAEAAETLDERDAREAL